MGGKSIADRAANFSKNFWPLEYHGQQNDNRANWELKYDEGSKNFHTRRWFFEACRNAIGNRAFAVALQRT
jgi:hypothetical protein